MEEQEDKANREAREENARRIAAQELARNNKVPLLKKIFGKK